MPNVRQRLRDALPAPWRVRIGASMTTGADGDDAARTLAVALVASIACHALLLAEWRWNSLPSSLQPNLFYGMGSIAAGQDASLRVELVSARDSDVTAEARPPAAASGTANDIAATPAPVAPVRKRPSVLPPPAPPLPADQKGLVNVVEFDDIGAVDSTLADAIAAEFPDPETTRPQLQQPLAVAYPEDALRAHRRMVVGVLVVVDEQGKIERTAKSFDDSVFAPAIDAALQTAQFSPALRDGHPVRFWTVLVFDFTIQGPPIFP